MNEIDSLDNIGFSVKYTKTITSPLDSIYYQTTKKLFDISLALLLLPFVSIILLILGTFIKLTSRGPVFYSSKRVGKDNTTFSCYKLRTMNPDAEDKLTQMLKDPKYKNEWDNNIKFKNDPRVTKFGTFLRKTSLDELPQIFNVLNGTMSFVGPRPILEEEAVKYGDHFEIYTKFLPGITGWWQINGRSSTTYEFRKQMLSEYYNKFSFLFDLKILIYTIPAVILRKGAR